MVVWRSFGGTLLGLVEDGKLVGLRPGGLQDAYRQVAIDAARCHAERLSPIAEGASDITEGPSDMGGGKAAQTAVSSRSAMGLGCMRRSVLCSTIGGRR